MSSTLAYSVKGYINYMAAGKLYIDTPLFEYATAIASKTVVVLAAGNNVITIPTGARGFIITFPNSIGNKFFKEIVGGTGLQIASAGQAGTLILLIGGATTQFVLNSSVADTGVQTTIQFF